MDKFIEYKEMLDEIENKKLKALEEIRIAEQNEKKVSEALRDWSIATLTREKRNELVLKARDKGYPEFIINDLVEIDKRWEKGDIRIDDIKYYGKYGIKISSENTKNEKSKKENLLRKLHSIIYRGDIEWEHLLLLSFTIKRM